MEINKKLLKISRTTGWSFNSTYIPQTVGYTNAYKNQTTCFVNLNFRIDTAITSANQVLISGLPLPIQRQTFTAVVNATPIRIYIDEQGNLKNDAANVPTGYINANITYPLK